VKIRITNFQSIEELEIEWEGLAVIRGPTNTGKSAIQRAVKYLLEGGRQAAFERLLKNGAAAMTLDLWFGQPEHHVGFYRNLKGENKYTIDQRVWTKIGITRPDELSDIGFKLIEANKKQLNPQFATQHGPLFLVGEESDPVTRAEALASLSTKYIKGVTNAGRQAATEERAAKQKAGFTDEQITEVDKKIKAYEPVEAIDAETVKLDALLRGVEQTQVQLDKLKNLKSQRIDLQLRQTSLEKQASVVVTEAPEQPSVDRWLWLKSISKTQEGLTSRLKSLTPVVSLKVEEAPDYELWFVLSSLKDVREVRLKQKAALEKVGSVGSLPDSLKLVALKNLQGSRLKLQFRSEELKKASDLSIVQCPETVHVTRLYPLASTYRSLRLRLGQERGVLDKATKELFEATQELQSWVKDHPECPTCGQTISVEHLCEAKHESAVASIP